MSRIYCQQIQILDVDMQGNEWILYRSRFRLKSEIEFMLLEKGQCLQNKLNVALDIYLYHGTKHSRSSCAAHCFLTPVGQRESSRQIYLSFWSEQGKRYCFSVFRLHLFSVCHNAECLIPCTLSTVLDVRLCSTSDNFSSHPKISSFERFSVFLGEKSQLSGIVAMHSIYPRDPLLSGSAEYANTVQEKTFLKERKKSQDITNFQFHFYGYIFF